MKKNIRTQKTRNTEPDSFRIYTDRHVQIFLDALASLAFKLSVSK